MFDLGHEQRTFDIDHAEMFVDSMKFSSWYNLDRPDFE